MASLADLSIAELLAAYGRRETTPSEAVEACLGRIDRLDQSVGAVLTLLAERAMAQAEESSSRWALGKQRALEGIPYGLKDIIATKGIRTTGGSPLYANFVPSYSATAYERLEESGAVLVAKLQTFEFAAGANAATSNPWDLERSAAGSSSGPAAAVAAHMLPFALGTDTGGSIALPAAFTGIAGLKPTYGLVSRHGVMPLSWTLDHVGPLARSAADTGIVLNTIAGYDPRDPTSSTTRNGNYIAEADLGATELRIGRPSDWFFDLCDPEVAAATDRAISTFVEAGASAIDVALPSTRLVDLHAIETTIVAAEAASLHRATFARLDDYGHEFARLLTRAQFIHAADYLQALRVRHLIQKDFEAAFDSVDVLIYPGCVSVSPRQDELMLRVGEERFPWADIISRTTGVFNIVGAPSLTIPSGFDTSGLPMAIGVAARPHAEATCIRVAHTYQQLTSHHRATPPIVSDDLARPSRSAATKLPPVIERPVVTTTRDDTW